MIRYVPVWQRWRGRCCMWHKAPNEFDGVFCVYWVPVCKSLIILTSKRVRARRRSKRIGSDGECLQPDEKPCNSNPFISLSEIKAVTLFYCATDCIDHSHITYIYLARTRILTVYEWEQCWSLMPMPIPPPPSFSSLSAALCVTCIRTE